MTWKYINLTYSTMIILGSTHILTKKLGSTNCWGLGSQTIKTLGTFHQSLAGIGKIASSWMPRTPNSELGSPEIAFLRARKYPPSPHCGPAEFLPSQNTSWLEKSIPYPVRTVVCQPLPYPHVVHKSWTSFGWPFEEQTWQYSPKPLWYLKRPWKWQDSIHLVTTNLFRSYTSFSNSS